MYRLFISNGFYAKQLNVLSKYFPSHQIKNFLFEDLVENPQRLCNDIFTWLKLPPYEIKKKVYNPTFRAKSQKLAKGLDLIRREDNLIKRLIKSTVSYETFNKMSRLLEDLNKTDRPFPKIDAKVEKILTHHFESHNKALKRWFDQTDKGCLVTYKENNWLSS